MNRHILFATIFMVGAATSANRQLIARGQTSNGAPAQKAAEQRASSIAGRVVDESGQPMPNAIVNIFGTSKQPAHRTINTDEDGKFRVDDLPPGLYSVLAQVRGYVPARDQRDPVYYRPGDSVNLVVRKGGVVTGTVTNSAGEPVVGICVSAIPRRDLEGRAIQALAAGLPRYTDDRGVYRLFSVPPGVYLVAAGNKLPGFPLTAFDEETPTYYPSSTRDTAAEIEVRSGSEAAGIDIRYRGERGYAISGSITDGAGAGSRPFGAGVLLVRTASNTAEAQASSQLRGNEHSFAFYGVAEGEYYIIAQRYPYQNDNGARSRPVSVKVKGQDITGVELPLVPLTSVAGRVTLEAAAADEKRLKCETRRAPSIGEMLVKTRRDQKEDPKQQLLGLNDIMGAPGDKGEFLLQGLEAGRYRIETRMLDEAWYVRAVTLPRAGRTPGSIDAGRTGFAAKPGERVDGLTVLVAEGAASLRGRVVAETKGASLPDRLRVHLIPAEQDAGDDTLRFEEAVVQGDGTFTLMNLAPGRYRLIARQAYEGEANERSPRPLAWDATSRANLRRDAEALNIAVDLKPCQRVADYELRYVLPKEAQKPKRP
jgi:Carboxypeptidase regulatory-like domain